MGEKGAVEGNGTSGLSGLGWKQAGAVARIGQGGKGKECRDRKQRGGWKLKGKKGNKISG